MTNKISKRKKKGRAGAKATREYVPMQQESQPQTHSPITTAPGTAQSMQPVPPPLSYPIGPSSSDATAFIQRAAAVLNAPNTAIYIDTSFLMWLTKGGADSRQQFFDWTATLGDRVHVPLWTYHEYYRHHSHDTLRSELKAEEKRLSEATKKYVELAKTYADDSFKSGLTVDAFHRELEGLLKKVKDLTETVAKWDYERAAIHISEWMSTKLCKSKVVFELMERLGQLGDTRYTQDLPPGYRDRTKKDKKNKGSNRFGDLILWEEVISHTPSTGAKNVVVLTRDRKDDWFARADAPVIEDDLLRLRGKQRWNPVPAPHPTLVFELRERTSAVELLLLDSLYLGAVLHQTGDANLARLIAYSLGVRSTDYVIKRPAAPHEVPVRPASTVPSRNVIRRLCDNVTMSPSQAQQSASVAALRTRLNGDVPMVEGFINQFGQQQLSVLSLGDAAWFARLTADDALVPAMPMAQQMVIKLVELLPVLPVDYAMALYAGMLASAYFEEGGPRAVPVAFELQKLFDQLSVSEYSPVLQFMSEGLRAARSTALFLPSDAPSQLKVRFIHDSLQEQTPLVLKQVALGDRNLLTNVGAMSESNLRKILGGSKTIFVRDFLQLLASHYGLPLAQLDVIGANPDDQRTLPAELGFVIPDDVQTLEAAVDIESDDILNATTTDEEDAPDEDKLDAQAFLEDDSDDY